MSSTDSTDDLFFAPEEEEKTEILEGTWKVLILDDDPQVHTITTMVLSKIIFQGRGLSFLHAYSGAEGCRMMASNADIAVAFVDVVMETDDAGLRFIRHIRDVLGNSMVRLILRTGQPGQSPEEDVIVHYDINDYKAKTELTTQKLFTTMISALRSYRDLQTIETSRQGLRKVIMSSSSLFELASIHMFVSGVLMQLSSLLGMEQNGILAARHGTIDNQDPDEIFLVAAAGIYGDGVGQTARSVLPPTVLDRIEEAFQTGSSVFADEYCIVFIPVPQGRPVVGYVSHDPLQSKQIDTDLLQIFCLNVGIAFDNFRLFEQLRQTQQAGVLALGKLAEFHDEFTGDHLARVEHLSTEVALQLCNHGFFGETIDSWYLDNIGLAAALHDVGKIGLSQELLCKPAKLTTDEFEIVKEHTRFGHTILDEAGRKVDGKSYLSLAAEVALCHHEKFDGSGYPSQLAGAAIPLSARIVAAVDVYDALSSNRPYKKGWDHDRVLDHMRASAGTHFDPQVVAALLEVVLNDGYSVDGKVRQRNRLRF